MDGQAGTRDFSPQKGLSEQDINSESQGMFTLRLGAKVLPKNYWLGVDYSKLIGEPKNPELPHLQKRNEVKLRVYKKTY